MSPLRVAAKNAAATSRLFLGHGKAGPLRLEMRPCTGGKLPARRRFAADRLRDFLETNVEHVVQQKGGAF